VTRAPGTRVRGSIPWYLAAFVLLVLAGAALVSAALGFLASTRLLWISAGLSALAIAAAAGAVFVPRR